MLIILGYSLKAISHLFSLELNEMSIRYKKSRRRRRRGGERQEEEGREGGGGRKEKNINIYVGFTAHKAFSQALSCLILTQLQG